jgi:hypothetical protein
MENTPSGRKVQGQTIEYHVTTIASGAVRTAQAAEGLETGTVKSSRRQSRHLVFSRHRCE